MIDQVPSRATPSADAWNAIRGAYDLHVHVAPDIIRRRIDDLDLARECMVRGVRGFVLKSHYVPTSERARVVTRSVPGIEVFGSLTLNHAIGGFNPVAVEVAGRSGCRVVWLPTVDAANEERAGHEPTPRVPAWLAIQREMEDRNIFPARLSALTREGELDDGLRQCLTIIAAYDMVLATGHLHRDEIFAVSEAARALGVKRIVITHPEFPTQRLTAHEQVHLAQMGAIMEHCYTTPSTGKCTWEEVFQNIRAVGAERCVLSTDLGQPSNPPVTEGLAFFAQHLLDAGFTRQEIHQMLVVNTARLLTPGTAAGA